MLSHSPVNDTLNRRHRRSCAIDTLVDSDPASDWTASPTLVDSDTPTRMDLEALEDIMAAAVEAIAMKFHYGELRCDPPPRPYSRGLQDRLKQDPHGWRRQYRAIRDIQERDKKIEAQQARIEALEAEVKHLQQAQVETESYREEQDVVAVQDLDDMYQLILEMEHDVKAAESTRIELNVKHSEERERYLALEGALEAERQAIIKQSNNINVLQATCVNSPGRPETDEQELRNEVKAVRADVDVLRATVNAIKVNAEAVHVLAVEKDMLQAHAQTLERQLHRHQLLAAEDRKIAVSEIARLAAERDEASKIADQYARQLQSSKDAQGSRSHGKDFAMQPGTNNKELPVPQARSSSLKGAIAGYRSLSMALVDSLTVERDLLREQKTNVENEKAAVETRKARLKEKFREVDRCRQDEHDQYCRQLAAMKVTIAKLTRERDAAIDAREYSDTILVDISSQDILNAALFGTAREFGRTHERTAIVKASMVTQQDFCNANAEVQVGSCQGRSILDSDSDISALFSLEGGWTSSGEDSFGGYDFGSTSTPSPKSDCQGDDKISSDSACSLLLVTPPRDADSEQEGPLSDICLSSSPDFASLHLGLSELWQPQAPPTVRVAEASDYFGPIISSSPLLPFHPSISEISFSGLSHLSRETASKYTSKCGLVSNPSGQEIPHAPVTRAAGIVRDSSKHGLLPPSWSELRVFEPP